MTFGQLDSKRGDWGDLHDVWTCFRVVTNVILSALKCQEKEVRKAVIHLLSYEEHVMKGLEAEARPRYLQPSRRSRPLKS